MGIRTLNSSPQKWRKERPSLPRNRAGGKAEPGMLRAPLPSCPPPSNPHLLPHPAELPPYTTVGCDHRTRVMYCPPRGKCSPSYRALQPALARGKRVPGPQRVLGCSKIRREKHRGSKLVYENPQCYLYFTFGD